MDFPKPDLASTDEAQLAKLVLAGRITLDEIPRSNRENVNRAAVAIKRKIAREKAQAAKAAKAKEKAKKEKEEKNKEE